MCVTGEAPRRDERLQWMGPTVARYTAPSLGTCDAASYRAGSCDTWLVVIACACARAKRWHCPCAVIAGIVQLDVKRLCGVRAGGAAHVPGGGARDRAVVCTRCRR